MELEKALGLRKGMRIIALDSAIAPLTVTKGRIYSLVGDASPSAMGRNYPGNCFFPIVDDIGRRVDAQYLSFQVA